MLRFSGPIGSKAGLLGAIAAGLMINPALAQTQGAGEDSARSVRIIDGPSPADASVSPAQKVPETSGPPTLTPAVPSKQVPPLTPSLGSTPVAPQPPEGVSERPQPSVPSPGPVLASPAPPANSASEGKPAVPVLGPPVPLSVPDARRPSVPVLPSPTPPPAADRPRPYQEGQPPGVAPGSGDIAKLPPLEDTLRPKPADLDAIASALKVANSAGLAMQILPGPDIALGSEVSFQVTSKKAGYLILLDVEADGKLVQIYPNPMSLRAPSARIRRNLNFLRPGKPLTIPDRNNPYAGFTFIASPPSGTAMVLAIHSDRPVQMLDLPDVPASLAGSASAVDYLTKHASELRIPDAGGSGRLAEGHWSFDAKFYSIR